jgi:hypothetical protein
VVVSVVAAVVSTQAGVPVPALAPVVPVPVRVVEDKVFDFLLYTEDFLEVLNAEMGFQSKIYY